VQTLHLSAGEEMSVEGIGAVIGFGDFDLPDVSIDSVGGYMGKSLEVGQEYTFTVKFDDMPPMPEPEPMRFILEGVEIGIATVNSEGRLEVQANEGQEGVIEDYLRELGVI